MSNFKADLLIDHKSKSVIKKNIADSYIRRLLGELPSTVLGIGIVVGLFIGYYKYSHEHKDTGNSVGSSIINAIIIIILGTIYRALANVLATWENHRYEDDFENSLVTKNFSF